MNIADQLAALSGFKGADLKTEKQRIVAALDGERLTQFLSNVPPAQVKKLTELFTRAFLEVPAAHALECYEATWATTVVGRKGLESALVALRASLTRKLDAGVAFAWLERHPLDPSLVDRIHAVGTVGQLRRAAAIGTPPPHVAAALPTLSTAPEGLSVDAAMALAKLGCTWNQVAASAAFPRVYAGGTYWEGTDPHGAEPRGGGWLVASSAQFPLTRYTAKVRSWDPAPSTVQLGTGGEVIEVTVDATRRILAPIGYVEETQIYFSVDLIDPSPDPQVYTIDHDGTGASSYARMMMFAYELKAPAVANA